MEHTDEYQGEQKKVTFIEWVKRRCAELWRAVAPGARAWRGAAWGGLVALVLILLITARGMSGTENPLRFAIGAGLLLALFGFFGGIVLLIWRILRGIPAFYLWVVACMVPVLGLLAMVAMSVALGVIIVGLGVMGVASLLGAAIAVLGGGDWQQASRVQRSITVAGLTIGLMGLALGGVWLLDNGSLPDMPPNAAIEAGAQFETLPLTDPSRPGPHTVRTLFYGSGQDRHRVAYGEDVDLTTEAVDGSALIESWTALRTAYWGFGPDALPLNGRVWYPEGAGPFPLVLIVHGQHPMEDYSDTGYAYLGELLASRGFIVASVDENFLNLSPLADWLVFRGLKEEDDLRAWLLLEHLCAWRAWHATPGNPFYQSVDLDNIALIGHSRGGEAVAVAAAFNRLPYYPGDATVRFDYDFNIRSVIAFAPVDGQYEPTGRRTPLEDVNYLVLHGAHDMDVFTFQGAMQYGRVHFTGAGDYFKATLYIYGANHGQFNTRWGRKDFFEPVMRVYNLAQLMPAEQQRQVAKVYISAFLEATLHGEPGYRPLFRDYRRGQTWLPDTIYVWRYEDARMQLVSTYQEDIDLTTTTLPGGIQSGHNLSVWRESPAKAKWEDFGDHGGLFQSAVILGWDSNELEQSAATSQTASYTIRLPAQGLSITQDSMLVFSLADANEEAPSNSDRLTSPPTGEPAPTDSQTERRLSKGIEAERAAAQPSGGKTSRTPIDLTIELVDDAGEVARLPLSHFSLLQPQIEAQLGKAAFMSPLPTSEAVFQHFEYPLADFAAVNPALDPANLAAVRLVFDRSPAGVVVLDNLGFW